ncbi:MAG: hypothetical protein J0L69_05420 [Bacteroidetes bacterium]|nr:hypothetical protein [Bacteroidota bacterium]
MEIIPIFVDENNPILSSSCYEEDGVGEFIKLFDRWDDIEFLKNYFTKHSKLLNNNGTNFTIEEAIVRTLKEAKKLRQKFIQLAKSTTTDNTQGLDEIFAPLHKLKHTVELTPSKAYGISEIEYETSWLRIYAIKLEENVYIVTGGYIKLSDKIQDTDEGKNELDKIKRTITYLKINNLIEKEDLVDFLKEEDE